MDSPRKLLVGYDLCEDYTQISCFSYKAMEPVQVSIRENDENYMIPTVLGLRHDTKQWLVGDEAVSCVAAGSGTLVENLLDKIMWEEVDIAGQKLSGTILLEKYLRKTLTIIKNYFPTEQITKLVVTMRNTDPEVVEKVYEALSGLGLERDRAVVMSHAGVYLYYALNQDKSLWMNDVGAFEFSREGLCFYQIHMNRRTKPIIAGIINKDYSDRMNISMLKQKDISPDYIFENIANEALYKHIITTLYLTGRAFEEDWVKEVTKNLCVGRRVFVGQNLYTKGACYAAKELAGDRSLEDFILLNNDMIMCSIAVRVYCDTTYQDVDLVQPGENWFEVDKSIEVIPDNSSELEIVIKSIMTAEVSRKVITINNFPKRPNRMTRWRIRIICKDKSTALLTVSDLGFGEVYQESGQTQEFIIEL